MKYITVPIKGMHCRSCEITLEKYLSKVDGVKKAEVSLRTKTATLSVTKVPYDRDVLMAVKSAGYDIGEDKKPLFSRRPQDYKDVLVGIIIVAILGFIISISSLDNLFNTRSSLDSGASLALFTGLAAGLSTCMALVGGLVLGLASRHAQKHPSATTTQKFRPHLFFNLGRIISFFILGGVIGVAGSVFQMNGTVLGVLTILVGVVMLVLGLQLTKLFPRLSNGGLTLPTGIARRLGLHKREEKEYSHKNAFILGAISFFLPCGFTQAMQLYAISTGSFVMGATIMGFFAIGTAPGLLGVGGLSSALKGKAAQRFFKVAGVAVVAMAFININSGYRLTGFQFSLPNLSPSAAEVEPSDVTVLKTTYTLSHDISPSEFTVEKGKKYAMEVTVKDNGQGCMSTIMIPGLYDKPIYLQKNKKIVMPFVAKKAGSFQITCAMGVPRGTVDIV